VDGSNGLPVDTPLRIVVMDRDGRFRPLRGALRAAGVTVIADAADRREAVELTVHYNPDAVLVDLAGLGAAGVAVMREILARLPGAKVVMLVGSAEQDDLALTALRAGAAGLLPRDAGLEAVVRSVRAVHDGETLVPRRMIGRLADALRATSESGAGIRPVRSPLTAREWEVLDLLCEALSTDEIADALSLSSATVRSHVKNVLRKLRVSSRREAVARARELRGSIISGRAAA
jgi:DNA-binding NarL/FixJ family response regulator